MAIDRTATLAWAREVTGEAAARARAMLEHERVVNQKADGTVVTDIDQAIERFLRERITERFPDHAILGEEYGFDGRSTAADAPLWAIDPIDGTTNLANGLPHWGVSVGLVEGGEPVVGVVAFPLLGDTYAGARGMGATRNDTPLSPLPAGGATHWEDTYATCSESVRRLDFGRVPARLRVVGSAALELCWTAAGLVRGCQSIGVSLYDVAAGICIARETGAEVGWLRSGETWTAEDMLTGERKTTDIFVCAPPATLAFLRDNVRG